MVLKIPPPPLLVGPEWQSFNRWLLELQSILDSQGGIDPSEVTGLPAVITQVGTNTTNITTLQSDVTAIDGEITTVQGDVTTLQGSVTALQGDITTINGEIGSLNARSQVFNGTADPGAGLGSNGDWFANTSGAAGHRIFVKVAGAWLAFPF